MVAEFVTRQHSASPINGETALQTHSNSTMPTNGHSVNMGRNGQNRHSHMHMHNISTSNSPTGFMHENHNSNGPMMIGSGPMSPSDQEDFPPGYDMAAHMKRKELFTQRKQREFIPDNKKDDSYWDRRRRNNEAAKRSREKRRFNDMVLEQRVVELTKENHVLKAQLDAIKDKYNICGEQLVSVEQIMATLPTTEQVLSITKRAKMSNGSSSTLMYPQSPSPTRSNSVIHQAMSESPSPSSQQHQSAPQRSQSPPPMPPMPSTHNTNNCGPMNGNGLMRPSHHYPSHMSDVMPQNRPASPMRSIIMDNTNTIIRPEVFRPSAVAEHFHNSLANGHSNGNGLSTVGGGSLNSSNGNGNIISRFVPYAAAAAAVANGALNASLQSDPHPYDGPVGNGASLVTNNTQQMGSVNMIARNDDLCVLDDDASTNVLNLSRRRHAKSDIIRSVGNGANGSMASGTSGGSGPTSPSEMSIGTGSSTASGDDEQCLDNQPINDTNNSLPLKLRHKSHLGDKDAASALLALQHIKQEPNLRLSPPWDAEGSSDERDSGISIGAAEWPIQRKIVLPNTIGAINAIGNLAANFSSVGGVVSSLTMSSVLNNNNNINGTNSVKEENIHLKSQLARLESEVANIKNMMILNTNPGSTTAVQ